MVTRKVLVVAIIVTIIVTMAVCWVAFHHEPAAVQPTAVVEEENATSGVVLTATTGGYTSTSSIAIKIKPQSLGNLPWGSMKGGLTPQEITSLVGVKFPEDLMGTKVLVNQNQTRFRKIGFVIDEAIDGVGDRKVYLAENVDIQRWDTFGISSGDRYVFEKMGDYYIARDSRGKISFFGYQLENSAGQQRIQSFANVPWRNLSGNIPMEVIAKKFTFGYLQNGGDFLYNPEVAADGQILAYNASDLETEKRGVQTTERGRFEQAIFSYNGKLYEARDVEVQPGDYPGGINPVGGTPSFLLLTVRAGKPEEKFYVAVFPDEKGNIVAAEWTKELPVLSSGGRVGSTSTFSSSSDASSSNPPGGSPIGPGPMPPI